jgi:ribosome maturation factor RimP
LTDVYTKEQRLEREIAPAVEGRLPDVEVLAVELLSPSRFCVYVDRPGGVDHTLCADVTALLDDYRNDYTIDVSSPGPERPLRKPSHFVQAVGRRVSLRTRAEVAGRARFRGVVTAADDEAVTVAVAGEHVAIPYRLIVRGNLIDEQRTEP